MARFDLEKQALVGAGGLLSVRADDEITRKLSMLIEGECEGLGPIQAAQKFGFSKQRYFQLRAAFAEHGAPARASCPTLYDINNSNQFVGVSPNCFLSLARWSWTTVSSCDPFHLLPGSCRRHSTGG